MLQAEGTARAKAPSQTAYRWCLGTSRKAEQPELREGRLVHRQVPVPELVCRNLHADSGSKHSATPTTV